MKQKYTFILIFTLALLARLYFVFIAFDPDNAGVGVFVDTYHRWQIAYLSRTIGWPQGHRLWDLRGHEYLWGILHPILLNVLFSLTGRIDIWLARFLSSLAGSSIAVLFFLFGKRFFNFSVGLASAFFIAFFPIIVLVDASGSIEPLSFFLLAWAVWFWPKKPFLTGFLLALAAAARIEAWFLAAGFLTALLLFKYSLEKWILSFVGFLVPIILYMKHLAVKAGSPIYPLREYFLGVTKGKWGTGRGYTFTLSPLLLIVLFVVIYFLILLWKKKPKFAPLFIFGFGGLGFGALFLAGFTTYSRQLWGTRFIYFSTIFLGFLAAVFLLYFLPAFIQRKKKTKAIFLICWLILLFFSQALWQPIYSELKKTTARWHNLKQAGERFSHFYTGKGKVLIPATTGDLTYALVRYGGLKGGDIVGQGFDILFYQGESIGVDKIYNWLKEEKIGWLIPAKDAYFRLIEEKPDWFEFIHDLGGYQLYRASNHRSR